MRSLSLLAVFILAKALILLGRDVPFNAWAPLAYLWQDVLVVLLFAAVDSLVRRPWFSWAFYSAVVLYVAINVPLVKVLSSPLTWPMLRATSTTLSDSIQHHFTLPNLASIAVILCTGCVFPFLLKRMLSGPQNGLHLEANRSSAWCSLARPRPSSSSSNPSLQQKIEHEDEGRGTRTNSLGRFMVPMRAQSERRLSMNLQPENPPLAPPRRGTLTARVLGLPSLEGLGVGLRGLRPRAGSSVLALALLVVALGPIATARVETIGLHRNFLVALVTSAMPRITARAANEDWRTSLTGESQSEDLSHLRGAAAGRNVVMILLESTAAQYLSPYGAAQDPMPNLTKLAQQSLLFKSAYAVYPESIKGLFAVLSSLYPAMDSKAETYSRITEPSIAGVLEEAGYRTALFHSGRFMYLGMEAVIRNRGYQILEDAGDIGGNHNSSFGVDETSTVTRMLSWIDSLPAEQRFFITYLPIAGHHPYDAPEAGPFAQDQELGRYLNALHYGDRLLGDFLRELQVRGLDKKTLFVIFGDHGEAFGQHEGNYGHTLFIYDENIRVPLLIAAPGLIKKEIPVNRTASLIDVAPTICDLLGLAPPAACQGNSLLKPDHQMALFFCDYSLGFLGLRDGRWKFIHELESGRSKLFDVSLDPEEKMNQADEFPALVSKYKDRLRRWCAAQKDLIARRARGNGKEEQPVVSSLRTKVNQDYVHSR